MVGSRAGSGDKAILKAMAPRGVNPVADLRLPMRLEVRSEPISDDERAPLLAYTESLVNERASRDIVDLVKLGAFGGRRHRVRSIAHGRRHRRVKVPRPIELCTMNIAPLLSVRSAEQSTTVPAVLPSESLHEIETDSKPSPLDDFDERTASWEQVQPSGPVSDVPPLTKRPLFGIRPSSDESDQVTVDGAGGLHRHVGLARPSRQTSVVPLQPRTPPWAAQQPELSCASARLIGVTTTSAVVQMMSDASTFMFPR